MNVMFVRSQPIDCQDSEWLEPIQVCCAFDCNTTLLLLPPASMQAQDCDGMFAELAELGIAAVHVVAGPVGRHSRSSSREDAHALLLEHSIVLRV